MDDLLAVEIHEPFNDIQNYFVVLDQDTVFFLLSFPDILIPQTNKLLQGIFAQLCKQIYPNLFKFEEIRPKNIII